MKTVIVTGLSSNVGYKIALELVNKGYRVIGTFLNHPIDPRNPNIIPVRIDLSDPNQYWILEKIPDVSLIVHTAALGNVDECETKREKCYRVNTVATRLVTSLAKEKDSFLVYISTDYVFDGERGLYRETDPPRPVNYYGLTKLLGEEAVISGMDSNQFLVVRTSAVYGTGPGRPNFGKTIVEKLGRGEKIKAFIDQYLSPTYNTLLAKIVVEMIERGLNGVYHVAGPRMSRYMFARKVAEVFGFDPSLIEPISMRDVVWKAPRPFDSSLNTDKVVKDLGTGSDIIRDIDKSLSMFRSEIEG